MASYLWQLNHCQTSNPELTRSTAIFMPQVFLARVLWADVEDEGVVVVVLFFSDLDGLVTETESSPPFPIPLDSDPYLFR
jgi:hypothetical protein